MSWTAGRDNPVIIYPAPNLFNAGFESALTGSNLENWQAVGAGTARVSTSPHSGSYCGKFNPAANTCYLDQYFPLTDRALKSVTAEASAGNFYLYFWAKAVSHTGDAYLEVQQRWLNAGYATLSTTTDYWPIGNTTPFGNEAILDDSTWRLYRSSPAPAVPATAVYVEILIGRPSAAETFELYVDDLAWGHALDGQDLGPYSYGARAIHPYDYGKSVPVPYRRNAYGRHAARRLNSGLYRGSIEFPPFTATNDGYKMDPSPWRQFIDYCQDGTAFSLQYNQDDVAKHYFSKCVLDMEGDGLEVVNGFSTRWKGAIRWRETP